MQIIKISMSEASKLINQSLYYIAYANNDPTVGMKYIQKHSLLTINSLLKQKVYHSTELHPGLHQAYRRL